MQHKRVAFFLQKAVLLRLLLLLIEQYALISAASPQWINKSGSNHIVFQWTRAVIELIDRESCQNSRFLPREDCFQLKSLPAKGQFYLAEAEESQNLVALLPISDFEQSGGHKGVAVFDPDPEKAFGHSVAVFFVDRMSAQACKLANGKYFDSKSCVRWAKLADCSGLGAKTSMTDQKQKTVCIANFVPVVFDEMKRKRNLLKCVNVRRFLPCFASDLHNTDLRGDIGPVGLRTQTQETAKEIAPVCQLFQKCDQAVLVSSGWWAPNNARREPNNGMTPALLNTGFNKQNIFTFDDRVFGNASRRNSLSVVSKHQIRRAIAGICKLRYCVDTFVLAFDLPSLKSGDLLLADRNFNAKADPDEIYKVSELVDDLRDCGADQTILIIDSPHSDRLLNELRNWLPFLRPIKVVASSEYGPTAKLTKLWTEADLKTQCVDDIFKNDSTSFQSVPRNRSMRSTGWERKTIYGAPCGQKFDFRRHQQYTGCHNVATYEFFQSAKFYANFRHKRRHFSKRATK